MIRAFTATFRLAINEDEVDDAEENKTPATIEQIKEWLKNALILDVDLDDHGNPFGFQSVEVNIETTLTELSPQETAKVYNLE